MRAKNKSSIQSSISAWLARTVGKAVPYRLLGITILSVIAADLIMEIIRLWVPPTPLLLHIFLDAAITILFVSPILFYTLFKPLVEQIRQRRSAERRLMESQKYYQAIVEDQTELICRFQEDGSITFTNQAYQNAVCDSGEATSGSFFANIPAENRATLYEQISALTAQQPVLTVEYPLPVCSVKEQRVLWTIRVITSPSGSRIGWQAVGRDTTEQYRILQELNQSRLELENRVEERTHQLQQINTSLREEITTREQAEQSLHHLMRQVPALIWVTDNAFIVRSIKGSILQKHDLDSEYFTGKMVGHDIEDLEMRARFVEGHQKAIRGEESTFEIIYRPGLPFHCHIKPFYDSTGAIIGTTGIALDVTDMIEREEKIRVQSTALKAAANGIIITDRSGCIQWSNPAFSRMTGYSAEEVLNQNPHILNSGFHDSGFFEDLWQTILAGQVWSGEIINRRKDGSIYVEEQTITPIRNERGEVTQYICIKNDVTRRKQAENDIRRRNWELSALNMISSKVSRSLEPAEIFSAMRSLLLSDLGITIGAIFTRAHTHQPFELAISWGWPEPVIKQVGLDVLSDEKAICNLAEKESFLLHNPNSAGLTAEGPENEGGDLGCAEAPVWYFCHCIPLLAQDEVMGVLQLYSDSPGGFTAEDVRLFESLTAPIGVAIQNALLFEEIQEGRARLQALSHRLVEIQENERRYIARELHDEASQALTYLIYALDILRKDAHSADSVEEDIAELDKIVQSVLENLHRLAVDLRPASLDLLGLIPAIWQYAQIIQEKHGIEVSFHPTGEQKRLPGDMETSIYRIIQEAVSNAVRHGQATQIEIALNQQEALLVLQVTDNGIGFDPQSADHNGRLGIVGMRERVEMLGGKMMVNSAVGKGTIIVVEVPNADSRINR